MAAFKILRIDGLVYGGSVKYRCPGCRYIGFPSEFEGNGVDVSESKLPTDVQFCACPRCAKVFEAVMPEPY